MNLKTSKRILLLVGCSALLSFTATAQQKKGTAVNQHTSTHKTLLASQDDIKKEMDLVDSLMVSYTLKKERRAETVTVTETGELPAEDIYGKNWSTERVNAYGDLSVENDSLLIDCSDYCMPLANTYVTSNFGPRWKRMHNGTDLKLEVGDTVYAAFSGKVRICNYERKGYGYYVVLRHNNGFETVYGHLSDFLVAEGQNVKVGQPIALGGNTGRSTGPHLHFEVRVKGRPIDPASIFDFTNQVAHRDTYVFNGKRINEAKVKAEKYTKGSVKYYRVKKGDTLGSVAKKNGLTVSQLCKLNNISSKKGLKIGQRLRCS